LINLINEFSKVRKTARAYFCYLLNRHLPNKLPKITQEAVEKSLKKLVANNPYIDFAYILDTSGNQIGDNIARVKKYKTGSGENRASRSYFYQPAKEKKCVLSDPYPSIATGELCVSSSMPIYNENNELLYIVVIDISLASVIDIVHIEKGDSLFRQANKIMYFIFSIALFAVAVILLVHGVSDFIHIEFSKIDTNNLFESTILLTLSLAIFDLVKTIIQEEIIAANDDQNQTYIHKTMIRFLGSIIIAIAIEGLMLVFKFSMTSPEKLLYATYLLGGVAVLIFALAYYVKSTTQCQINSRN
jgi:hypothetical protein